MMPGVLSRQCMIPVHNPILNVHHLLNNGEIRDLNGTDGYVSHSPELTTVIQVLVLKPKKVPDKAAEHLQEAEDCLHDQLVRLALHVNVVEAYLFI